MNYDLIKQKVLGVYRICKIHSFPLDCFEIYEHYNLKAHPYSTLEEPLKSYCHSMSEDSFIYDHIVCYNDDTTYPNGRIRFSLMHELGHHVLNHSTNRTATEEIEANTFASYLLAPRVAIHYTNCKNCNDVVTIFDVSIEAANIAFDDYRKWRRKSTLKNMQTLDKLLYYHFYLKEKEMFVWKQSICTGCNEVIYNNLHQVCDKCLHRSKQVTVMERLSFYRTTNSCDEQDLYLKRAEQSWLYGDSY